MNASKRLGLAGLVVSCLAAMSGCDCKGKGVGASQGDLNVVWRDTDGAERVNRDAEYDFGTAFIGDRVAKKLRVRNTGGGTLRLVGLERIEGAPVTIGDAVDPSAAFDVRYVNGTEVPASNDAEFDMFFTPRAGPNATLPTEPFWVKLLLSSSGTRVEDSTATILLRGTAEAGACQIPHELDFGPTPIGETFTLEIPLRNPGSIDAQGFVGALMGADAASFGVSPHGSLDVAAFATGTVKVTFSPTEQRDYTAQVHVKGVGECPEGTVTIKGSGTVDVLTWTPPEIDYRYVSLNVEAPGYVTFTNRSNVPITLTQVVTNRASDFAYMPPMGSPAPTSFVVPAGESQLKVICKPQTLGPKSATLSFKTGLVNKPMGTVNLKCFGGGPKINVTPRPTLSFGRVGFFPGQTQPVVRRISIANNGTQPNPPDIRGNLHLGQVTSAGLGQPPLIRLVPLNPNTASDEFQIGNPVGYDSAKGIEAIAGRNVIDLPVKLIPKSLGVKEAELTLYSNDPVEPAITVKLTADAQELPPCTVSVTPGQLNFGLVTPPTYKELPVAIKNLSQTAGETCYLSSLDLAPGTDAAYSIIGGPIDSKELQPQEILNVVIRVSPQGAVPTGVTPVTGTLVFNVSSPTMPQYSVPLSTAVGPSCLAVAPDVLDFGTVKKDCNSSTKTFNIYNVCTTPVVLRGFTVLAAAGEPAGGPNCPGSAPCPEFHLVSTPAVPMTGLNLPPGGAPVPFQAKYHPINFGPDSGAISIDVVQSGQSVTYLVSLSGNGDATGMQTDTFVQDLKPKADILMVVDDSCSMADKQMSMSTNFQSFIQYAANAGVDWQMGITTTSDDECFAGFPCIPQMTQGGKLLGDVNNPKVLTPLTTQVESKFSAKVKVGTSGSGAEQGFSAALKALTPPLITGGNAGLLRPDANLAIVVVTDASDQSPQPYAYYKNRLLNIKGFNRANMFTFNIIGPFLPSSPSGCEYDVDYDATSYGLMATDTNGVKDEICTPDWATKLKDLGKTAFGYRTTFFLNAQPDLAGGKVLEVKIDGTPVPGADWHYDAATNSVAFSSMKAPQPGQTLTVTYFTLCQ
ncbi:MAG: choice-of-anchor D domain-containing protein [Myxococcaceae bacterium]|nr:choice-of-anchor D domain-containing protein [Myxococcaceae bacterium]